MNLRYVDVLDHGDDPGRYTVVSRRGQVLTVNENGSIICRRKCYNPVWLIHDLSREPGVKVMKPALVPDLLRKINQINPIDL